MSAPQPQRPRRPAAPGARLLPVGRFFGVPLYFAPSWVLIAALITATYNSIIFDNVDGISRTASYVAAFGFAVALAVCILLHELGHVSVSLALHRPVRRVVIFLLGGISEIEGEIDRARDEFLVALAGPFVSLAVAGGTALGYHAVTAGTLPSVLLALLMWSNLVVALFNLLPGLPLDGGLVLRAAVWQLSGSRPTGTRVAAWLGRGLAVLMVIPAIFVRSSDWGVVTALFGIAIAGFIWFGATASLRMAAVEERTPRLQLSGLLRPGLLVPADMSVAEALRRAWEANARGLIVVDSGGQPRGIVDEHRIAGVPLDRRPWVPVSEVARLLEPGMTLPIRLAGDQLLAAIRAQPAAEYLVTRDDGSPAGVLAASDVAAVLVDKR